MRLTTTLALAAFVCVGCSSPSAPRDPRDGPLQQSGTRPSVRAGCTPRSFSFDVCWETDRIINVGIAFEYRDDLDEAVGDWNELLLERGAILSPRFIAQTGTAENVNVTVSGSGPLYCGTVAGSATTYTIAIQSSAQCGDFHTGTLRDALKHELSGVLGWIDYTEGLTVAGVSDRCAVSLPEVEPKRLNSNVCLHEVEGVFRAYRADSLPTGFWGEPVLHHSNLDTAAVATLLAGQTHQVTLSALHSQPPASYPVSFAFGPDSMTWSSSNGTVATVSSTGLVTASAAGSTYIRAQPRPDRVPANYAVWTPLALFGDSVQVTVTTPPSSGSFRITGITTPAGPPIVSEGQHVFTATISGAQPGVGTTVLWYVDFSDNGFGWDQIQSTTTGTYSVLVHGGSYHLRVYGVPYQQLGDSTAVGGGYTADLPVCTGQALGGGAGTDAPEGCGGGGVE